MDKICGWQGVWEITRAASLRGLFVISQWYKVQLVTSY